MPQPIDFAEARKRVTLEEVFLLISYSPRYRFTRQLYGRCPLLCCDYPRCCSFDPGRNLWRCHHCERGGNQFDLYAMWAGLSLYDAVLAIFRLLGREVPFKEGGRPF